MKEEIEEGNISSGGSSAFHHSGAPPPPPPPSAEIKSMRTVKRKKGTNFKWPNIVSRFLVSFLADQARGGMKVHKGFKMEAMAAATKAINEKFPSITVRDANCANHYRTLKKPWATIKHAQGSSGGSWDETTKTIIMEEDQYQTYIGAHPNAEPYINKPIQQYDEMALICDDYTMGCFAKSIGDPIGYRGGPSTFGLDDMDTSQATPNTVSSSSFSSGSKRSQNAAVVELGLKIAKELAEVAKALDGQEWTNELYAVVMEMEGQFPEELLESALEYLVNHRSVGQVFMARSLKSRANWLQSFSNGHPPGV